MLALTLHGVWAHLVAWARKDVENRCWPPGPALGVRIAIHAGANLGPRPGAPATREALQQASDMARLAGWRVALTRTGYRLEATAETWGWQPGDQPSVLLEPAAVTTSAVVAVARVWTATRDARSPWAVPGQIHWGLADVVPLQEPVPCGGALGLWSLTPDLAAQVGRQLTTSTPAGILRPVRSESV